MKHTVGVGSGTTERVGSVETTELSPPCPDIHGSFKAVDDLRDVSELVLVVSDDCRLCDRARAALVRLRRSFREVNIVEDEAGELAARGVPIVFFPVLLQGDRVLAYGDISERELRSLLAPTVSG